MATFASARLALRRSLAAPPRASSLGASLRQAAVEPSRGLHGPRLFSGDASASFGKSSETNKNLRPSESKVECKRCAEEKRIELIESLIKTFAAYDQAQRARIRDEVNASLQAFEEYVARQKNQN